MSSDLQSNMRATTEAMLAAWNGDWTVEPNLAYRAPNCQHTFLPKSFGVPTMNNEQFAAYLAVVGPSFTESKMIMDDYLAVPDQRKAVCRSTVDATTPVGPFHNEYVWFLTFDEDGKKIVEIVEFFDTKAGTEIRAKLDAAGRVPKP